jgi:3'(2'), 5'-bisphosphate nucleotidase
MFYQTDHFIEHMVNLIQLCNKIILNIYHTDFETCYKDDLSPLTLADKETNDFIYHELSLLNQSLNIDALIISEESVNKPYQQRKNYDWCWIVDPLDGTKEFIKKNDQFTCNIGLTFKGEPVFGIVSIPVTGEIFYGVSGLGSFKLGDRKLSCHSNYHSPVKIVVSNSHLNNETQDFLTKYTCHEKINVGSSIKLLLIAENKADIYPRLGPTSEWDICAAHAVLKYAGGKVLEYGTNRELVYNKENLLNPYFIASI